MGKLKKDQKPITPRGGVWQKLLDALYKEDGALVPNKKLIEVSGQHNYARRIRELRAEGWAIKYSHSPSGYKLTSCQKTSKNCDIGINLKLRLKVLSRDAYVCQKCGHKGGELYSDGAVVKLEVDHILPLDHGGKTVEENLWTLCSRCNAGKKSLFAYPETIKHSIISLNLPEDVRKNLTGLSLETGQTVNDLLLVAIKRGLEKIR